MLAYRIDDMTCGGCVRAIRAAIAKVAPEASVQADVAARRITIEGADHASAPVAEAIGAAGFAPVEIDPTVLGPGAAASGCGCGSGRGGCA
jgi:copper chaperone